MSQKRKDTKGRLLREGEYQRPDGRYMYCCTDKNGNKITVYSWRLVETDPYITGRKKDISLREKEQELQKNIINEICIAKGRMILDDMVEHYFNTKKRLRKNTMSTYRSLYAKNVSGRLGKCEIKNIKKSDILQLYDDCSNTLSNGTIQNIHNNILFPAFQLAVEDDYIRKNPCCGCLKEYPYDAIGIKDALTIEEQHVFMKFLKNDKVYSKYFYAVALILATAMRRGETLGITWNDIDLESRMIDINHQLCYHEVDGKYKFEICLPKTDSGIRQIPIYDTAYELLKEIKEETRLNNVTIDGHKNFLFVNTNRNNPIIPRQLSDSLEAACKKYNKKEIKLAEKEDREPQLLPNITSHILRHTACTRMAEAGVDLKVIQGIMGHKHIETTMEIYNHVNVQRMNQESKKMNNIVTLDFTAEAVI